MMLKSIVTDENEGTSEDRGAEQELVDARLSEFGVNEYEVRGAYARQLLTANDEAIAQGLSFAEAMNRYNTLPLAEKLAFIDQYGLEQAEIRKFLDE